MHHAIDTFRIHPGFSGYPVHTVQNAYGRILRSGKHFGGVRLTGLLIDQQQVGKRAANIDTQAITHITLRISVFTSSTIQS
jgi:hypothetical protein